MIMRGPMLHNAIRQFFTDVEWGRLDYMIVDLPPGTGDAPLSLAQSFPLTGSIIVTQPQDVAVADAIRAAAMFEQLKVPLLGVVENMSGEFFGSGGGEKFANDRDLPFLGRIPLSANVREGGDYGRPIVIHGAESEAGPRLSPAFRNRWRPESAWLCCRAPTSFRLISLVKGGTRSVVHAHDLDFFFVIDRIVTADKQPKQSARQDAEHESEQRLLVKIVLDGGVVMNDQKAEKDEGN